MCLGGTMEIQTFLLAQTITMRGNRFDIGQAPIANMTCTAEVEFPTRFTLPAFILLRRDSWAAYAPYTVRLTLVDEDGVAVGRPNDLLWRGHFPAGVWFAQLMAKIDFEFPAPGRYRLELTPDEGLTGQAYHYNISITESAE
jgi:hypothetical protein